MLPLGISLLEPLASRHRFHAIWVDRKWSIAHVRESFQVNNVQLLPHSQKHSQLNFGTSTFLQFPKPCLLFFFKRCLSRLWHSVFFHVTFTHQFYKCHTLQSKRVLKWCSFKFRNIATFELCAALWKHPKSDIPGSSLVCVSAAINWLMTPFFWIHRYIYTYTYIYNYFLPARFRKSDRCQLMPALVTSSTAAFETHPRFGTGDWRLEFARAMSALPQSAQSREHKQISQATLLS